jgi:hypothetical protein
MTENSEDKIRNLAPADVDVEKSSDPSSPAEGEATTDDLGVMPNAEFLKKLPPEARKVVEIGMSMHRFGPMLNPLTGNRSPPSSRHRHGRQGGSR